MDTKSAATQPPVFALSAERALDESVDDDCEADSEVECAVDLHARDVDAADESGYATVSEPCGLVWGHCYAEV